MIQSLSSLDVFRRQDVAPKGALPESRDTTWTYSAAKYRQDTISEVYCALIPGHRTGEFRMFIGTLATWDADKKFFPSILDTAVAFLKSLDPEKAEPGRYAIQGNEIYASIECGTGKPEDGRRFELHHRYIDVQMILTGDERQDITTSASATLLEDRLQNDDIAFYSATESIQTLTMHPGMFIIYFPGDLHAPGLYAGKGSYKKVVVKVAASLVS